MHTPRTRGHPWASVLPGRGRRVRAGAPAGWALWGNPLGEEGAGTWTLLMLVLVTHSWGTQSPGQRHIRMPSAVTDTQDLLGREASPAGHTALLPMPAEPSWPAPQPPSDLGTGRLHPSVTLGAQPPPWGPRPPSPCEATGRWTSCDRQKPCLLSPPPPQAPGGQALPMPSLPSRCGYTSASEPLGAASARLECQGGVRGQLQPQAVNRPQV